MGTLPPPEPHWRPLKRRTASEKVCHLGAEQMWSFLPWSTFSLQRSEWGQKKIGKRLGGTGKGGRHFRNCFQMSGKSPVRSPALPKAGSESSFAYIWTQRGSEFPEIRWNTALQNSVCISGTDKKMDIWHLHTLPTLVRKSLSEPAALPGLPAARTCSSRSFGPVLRPSMFPTALAWGLTLRISNTANPSMLYQWHSWKKRQWRRNSGHPQSPAWPEGWGDWTMP